MTKRVLSAKLFLYIKLEYIHTSSSIYKIHFQKQIEAKDWQHDPNTWTSTLKQSAHLLRVPLFPLFNDTPHRPNYRSSSLPRGLTQLSPLSGLSSHCRLSHDTSTANRHVTNSFTTNENKLEGVQSWPLAASATIPTTAPIEVSCIRPFGC